MKYNISDYNLFYKTEKKTIQSTKKIENPFENIILNRN